MRTGLTTKGIESANFLYFSFAGWGNTESSWKKINQPALSDPSRYKSESQKQSLQWEHSCLREALPTAKDCHQPHLEEVGAEVISVFHLQVCGSGAGLGSASQQ